MPALVRQATSLEESEALISERVAITGRTCGDCSLCCKLINVREPLNKPRDVWCQHCRPGKGGCSIYDTRPDVCRGFACDWLVKPNFGQGLIWAKAESLS
jgi:hypothetical protein